MTTKVALERIYNALQRTKVFEEEYDTLSNAIETLDIIKHYFKYNKFDDKYIIEDAVFDGKSEEQVKVNEYKTIKRWLSNDR